MPARSARLALLPALLALALPAQAADADPAAAGDAGSAPAETAPAAEGAPVPAPVSVATETGDAAAEPELLPPDVDAYVDISLGDADYADFGYDDNGSAYRLLAGWILPADDPSGTRWSAEISYSQLGSVEDDRLSFSRITLGGRLYEVTTTDTYSLEASSLGFGMRASRAFGIVEPFARLGAHYYHVTEKRERVRSFTPITPNSPPQKPQQDPSSSESEVGLALYGAAGVGVKTGEVATVYGEYAVLAMAGESVPVARLGLIANF